MPLYRSGYVSDKQILIEGGQLYGSTIQSLGGINDVSISGSASGDLLVWNGSNAWENKTIFNLFAYNRDSTTYPFTINFGAGTYGSGTYDIALGRTVGSINADGNNITIGRNVMNDGATGCTLNVLMGDTVAQNLQVGDRNVIFGSNADTQEIDTNSGVGIGPNTITSDFAVAVGANAEAIYGGSIALGPCTTTGIGHFNIPNDTAVVANGKLFLYNAGQIGPAETASACTIDCTDARLNDCYSLTATNSITTPVINNELGVEVQYDGTTKVRSTSAGCSVTGDLSVSNTIFSEGINAGDGIIQTTVGLECDTIDCGGTITTLGGVVATGTVTCGSIDAGSGLILTTGAVECDGLDAGTSTIITTGAGSFGTTVTVDDAVLSTVGGSFGSLRVTGGNNGGWNGIELPPPSTGMTAIVMVNGDNIGWYNATEAEWLFSAQRNGGVLVRHNGVDKFTSSATGLDVFGDVIPTTDNVRDLGSISKRWDDVYATNGTIQTSDETKKDEIDDSPLGLDFIMDLKPKTYKWKDFDYEVEEKVDGKIKKVTKTRTFSRKHTGLLAQDIKQTLVDKAISTNDFAGYVEHVDPETEQVNYGLRYSEFIGVMIKAIQELSNKVEQLENGKHLQK